MSYGFHAHPDFKIVGAVDRQNGKPSSGEGSLECNSTYETNIGIKPLDADIKLLKPSDLRKHLKKTAKTVRVDVLISCAPCTGFSRTIRQNLVEDDARNSLVAKSADFVEEFMPSIFLMENVGELLKGKFTYHFDTLSDRLRSLGYEVTGTVHNLSDFGVPQSRKRALIVAVKKPRVARELEDLWDGFVVSDEAKTVRRAIGHLTKIDAGETHPDDPMHTSPRFGDHTRERLRRLPHDGGDWPALVDQPGGWDYLIPSMERHAKQGKVGPYRDVYGRLWWDKPAVTIKRECAHTGNGRYAHPDQDRLCTVREMGILQGFPNDYSFSANSLSNMYRHIGDAVPPLVSYQIAFLCRWILTGDKPAIEDVLMPGGHLMATDIVTAPTTQEQMDLLRTA